ncbi:hypothetical protein ruthe_00356 [Rubellimicrobium thermophilum DSM 16684]|uniref:Uncharacterized protein n=1 Tax=Rubellimicrobium thermophilum DSM 16684 TaxID=1123069 RepID=S9SC15_9RHOB|nr:hypothetical protein ruthe_00356 [Rubellimicrobium thermophilum DSM 16684]
MALPGQRLADEEPIVMRPRIRRDGSVGDHLAPSAVEAAAMVVHQQDPRPPPLRAGGTQEGGLAAATGGIGQMQGCQMQTVRTL